MRSAPIGLAVSLALVTSGAAQATALYSASGALTVSVLTRNEFLFFNDPTFDNNVRPGTVRATPPNMASRSEDAAFDDEVDDQAFSVSASVTGSAAGGLPPDPVAAVDNFAGSAGRVLLIYEPEANGPAEPLPVGLRVSYDWSIGGTVDDALMEAASASLFMGARAGAQTLLDLSPIAATPPNFLESSGGAVTEFFTLELQPGSLEVLSSSISLGVNALGMARSGVPVPEPSSLALLIAGLGAIELSGWLASGCGPLRRFGKIERRRS